MRYGFYLLSTFNLNGQSLTTRYQWRAFVRELEPDHASLMRDAGPNSIVVPSSNQHIIRFRTNYADTHLAFIKTIRVRHMAVKTEKTYEQWIARFLRFCNWQKIDKLGLENIRNFLEYLAVSRKVSVSTQKVALNALIFLFWEVLGQDVKNILSFTRASSKQRIPTVLSVDEIKCLFKEMNGRSRLMASLTSHCLWCSGVSGQIFEYLLKRTQVFADTY